MLATDDKMLRLGMPSERMPSLDATKMQSMPFSWSESTYLSANELAGKHWSH